MPNLRLLLVVLLASALPAPAAAALQAGPQVLPGDLVVGPAGGVQQFPAIAAGSGAHLVAWADHRSAFETLTTGVGTRDVYAILVGAAGVPLTPLPFRVAGGLGRKEDVRVAWNGTHWLVTWQVEVPTQFAKAAALHAARVDAQGQLVDVLPLAVRTYGASKTFAYAVASDGSDWVAVIQGSSGGESSVEAWRISPGGAVAQASPALFATSSLLLGFQLAWDGGQYLFSWNGPGVRGQRFDAAFTPLGGQLALAPSDCNAGNLAANPGGGFLVAFHEDYNGYEIQYRTVTSGGALGPIVQATNGFIDHSPAVAWNGNGYTLAWTDGYLGSSDVRYARVSATGALLDPQGGLPIGGGTARAFTDVASLADGNAQIVWVDSEATPPHAGDVSGARVTPAGAGPLAQLSTSAPRQGAPDLAAGGPGHLAVFTSERNGAVSILAQRLDAQGNALDPEPIELGADAAYGHPRAAWNGACFLVVWHDEGALDYPAWETDDVVLARRVGADGALLDPAPFQVMDGGTPDVAAANGVFLVAARHAFTTELFHLRAARVDGSGAVLDPTSLLVGGNFARFPSVGSFGDRWVVAWQRNPTHDHPARNVEARVVLTDGSMTAGVWLGAGGHPAVAASGAVALVVWSGAGARRLGPDAVPLGNEFGLTAAGGSRSAVAWNGSVFVAAWEDLRNQAAFFDDRRDVFATRVAEDGTNLDGAGGFAVAASPEDEQHPAVAGSGGSHLFALADFRPAAPYAAVRTAVVPDAAGGCASSTYCTAAPNSAGPGATIGHQGSASLAANDLVLTVAGAVPLNPGIFFYGAGQTQTPFGDGFLCVAPGGIGTFRLKPVQLADASGAAALAVDLLAPPDPAGQIGPGSTWNFQYWYRDPAGVGPTAVNLSDALSLTFCP